MSGSPPSNATATFVSCMRAHLLHAISEAIGGPLTSYALVEFPNYDNVGDSAIWLGEISLLRELAKRPPVYVATQADFNVNELISFVGPDGVIFLQGGGNFGDLYSWAQSFRVALLNAIPTIKVVQLPCSWYFKSEAAVATTCAAVANHGRFVFIARERDSFDRASARLSCPVLLAPDAAFGLGPQRRPPPVQPLLRLLRTDAEAIGPMSLMESVDWSANPKLEGRARGRGRRSALVQLSLGRMQRRLAYYNAQAELRVQAGLKLLSRGERMVSDRLHGHILGVLLSLPHIAVENETGKTGATWRTWTQAAPLCRYAQTIGEAEALARNGQPAAVARR